MATVIQLPRLSDTMEEGVVATWKVKPGDKVKRGQVIADIETDKATMEFESFDPGIVLRLVAAEGESLPIGAAIAVFGKDGEDVDSALASFQGPGANASSTASESSAPETPTSADEPTTAEEEDSSSASSVASTEGRAPESGTTEPAATDIDAAALKDAGSRVAASPLARRMALEGGLDIAAVPGTGPHGRVIKADIERALREGVPARPAATAGGTGFAAESDRLGRPYATREGTRIKLTQMRKAIKKRMTQSQQEVPHFYLTIDIDMEAAAKVRADYNLAVSGTKVSYNDMLISAMARALRDHARCNASWMGDHIFEHGDVHMGVAVAIEDGLVVPVVRYADQKTLEAISREVRDLGKRAKSKALAPEEMSGSTFTISNLGMFGISEFAAVVNPGEGGILAVGQVADTAVAHDGQISVRKRMKATLSCDHRVIDGAVGAQLLATLREYLEQPMRLFT